MYHACTACANYSLDRFLSRVSKGPRANNCHGPRLALIRHWCEGTRRGTEMFSDADGRSTETGLISRCPAGCSRRWVRRLGRPGRRRVGRTVPADDWSEQQLDGPYTSGRLSACHSPLITMLVVYTYTCVSLRRFMAFVSVSCLFIVRVTVVVHVFACL